MLLQRAISSVALPLLALASTAHTAPTESFQSRCESLPSTLQCQDGANVTIAKYLPAGSVINHTAEGLNETCIPFAAPPLPVNICRVVLTVPTSESSGIRMEAWLPEDWSGRFLSTGNGGFAGCIQYPDIAYATQYGFAAVGTNNGHEGQSGGAWYHQPEVLKDFVWRALYTGVIVGKDITKQFYGKEHSKSYYIGCSTGGRQAWKAVQSYPDLFDGVIAGAPAIDFLGLLGWGGYAFSILGFNPNETLLTGDDWAHVHEIVLEQCDNIDGAKDGIVEDIRLCKPDFSIYVCNHGSSWCLTEEQISAIQKLFSPFVVDGKIYHSGAAHGDEVRLIETLYGPFMGTWLEEYFRFVVKEDLTWLRSQFTVSDAKEAMDQNPFNVQTFDTDISAFRDRGGKVLHWHGQADEYLAVTNSDRYYDSVAKTLNTSPKELDEFYRYFRISGMGHCFGGPGSNILGQGFGMAASDDPDDNVLVRIVEWVEKGNAPEIMRATKYNNDNTTQGIAYARKHCRYPLTNKYTGSGDGTDEEGWHCVSL